MKLEVWAPFAERVNLVLVESDVRVPMTRLARGHFAMDDERLFAGVRYGFSLDDGPVLPDPRSRKQPGGVHAPSEYVDPASFHWTDADFRATPFERALLYELHIGTFTEQGTFESAIERLPHLAALGVTHVEVMPVAAFPGDRGWGYDGVYPYAVHQTYGGAEGLQRFVDAAHAHGVAVVLDVVYNHLGPSGCYVASFGPYFTGKYRTPWGEAFNFDGPSSDAVRRFVCDNALYWLEHFHLDGLRLDAVQEIFDASPLHILEQLQGEVEALGAKLGKALFLLVETPANDPRLLRPRELGGYGLRAQWNDEFHHALRVVLSGERAGYFADYGTLAQLARATTQGYVYQGEYSNYRDRAHGRKPEPVQPSQFVAFAQNHDQVGNRPRGDRLSATAALAQLKQAAALVMLSPCIPMLFMGEEWAASTPFPYFTDHDDPGLTDAVRHGRMREFGEFGWPDVRTPDPGSEETFRSAKLRWEEVHTGPHEEIYSWHFALSNLRRTELTSSEWPSDDVVVRYDEERRWFALRVKTVCLALNFGSSTIELGIAALDLGANNGPATARVVMTSSDEVRTTKDMLSLPPGSTLIWVG